jgi:hypothetical protein
MASRSFESPRDQELRETACAALLRDLIDYAGLFPPASLDMASAVAKYDEYLRSEWNWILGRFIVPVSRLEEFKEAMAGLKSKSRGFSIWRLSAIVGKDVVDEVDRVRRFNARGPDSRPARKSVIESLEVKVDDGAEIKQASGIAPAGVKVYFEVPAANPVECMREIANCGRRAKIRTGGETADKFPPAARVIEFLQLCVAHHVPFKATAGLHHPLRSIHRLTYKEDSPSGLMHGFLNVFLAAALVRQGVDAEVCAQLLEEQSSEAFRFAHHGIDWREHHLTRDEIVSTRKMFAASFGSCSFSEPIDDLKVLHLI